MVLADKHHMLCSLQLFEHVLVCRDATTGQIGMEFLLDCIGRAPQRLFLEGLYNGSCRSQLLPGQSGILTVTLHIMIETALFTGGSAD